MVIEEKNKCKIKFPYPIKDERYRDACLSKCDDLTEDQAESIKKWIDKPKNFLFIHSDYGIGKTYLIAAIANARHEKNLHTYYFDEAEMAGRLRSLGTEGKCADAYIWQLCGNQEGSCNPFMIWDDFGSTIYGNKNSYTDADMKQAMYQFINVRYNCQLPTVVSSNYSIQELGDLVNPRIGSRLAATENLIIKLIGEDKRAQGL